MIDFTTLRLSILLTTCVCVLALLTVWRIDRHSPGVLQMTLGISFNLFAFLTGFAASLGVIAPALSTWITNMCSLLAVFILLEGMLRFRGIASESRWKLVFVLIILIGFMNWWNVDNPVRRYLYHDAIAVVVLLFSAIVMIWRTQNIVELRTYALASLFSLLMAIGFLFRLLTAWQAQSTPDIDFTTANSLLYTGILLYMVGLSFAVVAACYLKSHQSVLRQASEDSLTGLPNRRSIDECLARTLVAAKRSKQAFAVALMDLNKFKYVNDTHGHDVGDALLVEVARRLRGYMRESDFVGRLGGDEFLLVLSDVKDGVSAHLAVDRLRAEVNGTVNLNGHSLSIDVSLGLAIWPNDADSVDGLLRVADQLMYEDKMVQAMVTAQFMPPPVLD